METSVVFKFKTYKIKGQNISELEKSDNPFAIVVLTVLIALQKSEKLPEDLLQLSLGLAKQLFKKGFSKKKVESLLFFIGSHVHFDNQSMFNKFNCTIGIVTNKMRAMGIKEQVFEMLREEGFDRGIEKSKKVFVETLLKETDFSIEKIADLVDVDINTVSEIKKTLSLPSTPIYTK